MTKIINFHETKVRTKIFEEEQFVRASDIAKALGYKNTNAASGIYRQYQEEFESHMVRRCESRPRRGIKYESLYFNRRGAWLIGMFARTERAKEFRKWVLDVLEEKAQGTVNLSVPKPEKVITLEQYEIIFGASQRLIKEIEQRCEALAAINNDKQASTWLRDKLLEEMKDKIHVLETGLMEKKYPGLWKNMPVHQIVKQFEEEERAFIGEQKLLR